MRRMLRVSRHCCSLALTTMALTACSLILPMFNHMTVDGQRYSLNRFAIVSPDYDDETGDGPFELAIALFSDGVTLDPPPLWWSGSGEILQLSIHGPSRTLGPGDYSFDSADTAFSITIGDVSVGGVYVEGAMPSVQRYVLLTRGSLSVREAARGESILDFSLQGVDENDVQVTVQGRYRGRGNTTVIPPPVAHEGTESPPPVTGKCYVSGCSGEICSEDDWITPCLWRETYACYQHAVCERQAHGGCGWTYTSEYSQCIVDAREREAQPVR